MNKMHYFCLIQVYPRNGIFINKLPMAMIFSPIFLLSCQVNNKYLCLFCRAQVLEDREQLQATGNY